MKGTVFTIFSEMVEEAFGLEMWDTLIEETQPESEGVYTSAGDYPSSEIFAYVMLLSKKTQTPVPDLLRAFGKYTLGQFSQKYPQFFEIKDFKSFLMSIDRYVHIEVRKLYPTAELPEINYESEHENQLTIIYRSPRKLCFLAEGLLQGASDHFKAPIQFGQSQCMHEGHDSCHIRIQFNTSE